MKVNFFFIIWCWSILGPNCSIHNRHPIIMIYLFHPTHPIHTCHQMWKQCYEKILVYDICSPTFSPGQCCDPGDYRWAQVRKTLRYSNRVFRVVHVGKSLEKWIFFFKSSIRWKFSSKVKLVKMFFSLRYESSTVIHYKELSSPIFQSLWVSQSVSQASVTPHQISTLCNI